MWYVINEFEAYKVDKDLTKYSFQIDPRITRKKLKIWLMVEIFIGYENYNV